MSVSVVPVMPLPLLPQAHSSPQVPIKDIVFLEGPGGPGGCWFLVHLLTQERVDLGPGLVQLCFDADDKGFIERNGQREAVMDLLKESVGEQAGQLHIRTEASGHLRPLSLAKETCAAMYFDTGSAYGGPL